MRQSKKLRRQAGKQLLERLESRTHLSVTLVNQQFNVNGVNLSVGVVRVLGSASNDIVGVWLNRSNQLVVTENGKDYIFDPSAVGRVYFEGREGNDRIEISANLKLRLEAYGGAGNDTLIGALAHDSLVGNGGDDYIAGGAGNNTMRGALGSDRLFGGAGSDVIYGGVGDDTISSGAGTDAVYGGAGANDIDPVTLQPMSIGKYEPQAFLSNVTGYDPGQIRRAYGFGELDDPNYTTRGQGQTIYIITSFAGANPFGDLVTFSRQFNLPVPTYGVDFQIVNASGHTPARDAGWAAEADLDLQWAHAIAPAARLVLVQADSNITPDALQAIRVATNLANAQGGGIVSISAGVFDFDPVLMPDLPLWEQLFKSNPNVTYTVSSGDGVLAYPGMSPYVTSVGGTRLELDSEGNRVTEESAWIQGGAGFANPALPEPAYQFNTIGQIGLRACPDVSYDSDPATGVAVFLGTPLGGNTGWFSVGGTSAAAPQWAGLVALVNQRRADAGKPVIGADLNSTLYDLYDQDALYTGAKPLMNDVIDGSALGFPAGVGYDLATGLGTPNGDNLANALSTFQPFYIESQFDFTARFFVPSNTPTDPDIQPRPGVLFGQRRDGHGFISGGDMLDLTFVTDRTNTFDDPFGISAGDSYFDVEPGQVSLNSVRLFRTGRDGGEQRIYGFGRASIFNTDPSFNAAMPTPAIFEVKFEGTWWTDANGEIRFHVEFHAVDPVSREPITSGPFDLRYTQSNSYYGGYFAGELEG